MVITAHWYNDEHTLYYVTFAGRWTAQGADDSSVSSFACLLADAVRLACAVATRSILKPGTQVSFPTRVELGDLLD